MDIKPLQQPTELLCINTNKVYDWILEEATASQTILAATLALPAAIAAVLCLPTALVKITPILTDVNGIPLPPNSEVTVTELQPRVDRQFEVDGALVTLQKVSFSKIVYVVLEISGVIPATGVPFLVQTLPLPFTVNESAFLCAPAGTQLLVSISDFEAQTVLNCDAEGVFVSIGLSIVVCQSIQTVSPVTLELTASFCSPREPLFENCPRPTIPPQCPVVFPGS